MLRLKFAVKPLPWAKALDRGFKTLANNLSYYSVAPLRTDRKVGFIAGCGHSGTTLLTAKLSTHPAVFTVGRESNNFSILRNLYCSREILREWCYTAEQQGKTHVLEKTPKHVHTIGRILRVLPQARIILMVRNPLDTCASIFARFGNLKFALTRWLEDTGAVHRALKQFPESIRLVRYEDLTEDPESVLREVCVGLGLEWNPALLGEGETVYDLNRQERGNMKLRRDQVRSGISANSGTWKDRLTEAQAAEVRSRTALLAEVFGYGDEFYSRFAA